MKTIKTTGKIDTKERINNSYMGNPRYEVIACIAGVDCPVWIAGKTATDAACGYGNWKEGDAVEIEYHRTKAGNVIFDRIKETI